MVQIQKPELTRAKEKAAESSYALLYYTDRVLLTSQPDPDKLEEDRLQEAYYFGKLFQLHMYREDGQAEFALAEDERLEEEHTLIRTYDMTEQFAKAGRRIKVKEYLEFDEDGQCFVGYTRLCGIEEADNG